MEYKIEEISLVEALTRFFIEHIRAAGFGFNGVNLYPKEET